jgi:soluble lytic murein transglycosylase
MMRVAVLLTLLVFADAGRAGLARAESAVTAIIGPPYGSFRGEVIDTGDLWDSARLLACFGEDLAAYELLRREEGPEVRAVDVERLQARLLTEMGLYDRADSLLALRGSTVGARDRYLHYLWRARLSALCGRYETALDFINILSANSDTLFAPYGDLMAVEAFLRSRNPAAARETAERRLNSAVPRALATEFKTRLLEAYLHEGNAAEALAFVQKVREGTAVHAPAQLVAREVDIRFMLGDTLGALDAAVDLVREYGTSSVAAAVDTVLRRVPVENLPTPALLAFGDFLVQRGRANDAEQIIEKLRSRPLEPAQGEQLRLMYSKALYGQKRYTAAEKEGRKPFEDAAFERQAKLLRARIYRATGERQRSAEAYEAFARTYPYDSKAAEALYVAWDMQQEAGNAQRATAILKTIVETYPSHKYARLATLRIAFDHVERGEYHRGARLLEQALERRGRDDEAYLYYLADVYGRMGLVERRAKLLEELSEVDPLSFYLDPTIPSPHDVLPVSLGWGDDPTGTTGLLEFLSSVVEARGEAYRRLRVAVKPWEDWPTLGEPADCLTRGRAFAEMGMGDWADAEFRAAESAGGRPASGDLALAELYDDLAMPWRSVRALTRVYYSLEKAERRRLDGEFRLLTFPLPYPALVFDHCARNGIAAHLVYAMMREESRFDEKAVSPAGAMGLMQIMPATGRQLAEELGLPEGARGDLLSAGTNVSFGVWYAARLMERSDRDPLKMLAAYNAGYGNASRWFGERSTGKTVIERVDGIDFWETREYVKRIVESAHAYHSSYFSPQSRFHPPRN